MIWNKSIDGHLKLEKMIGNKIYHISIFIIGF